MAVKTKRVRTRRFRELTASELRWVCKPSEYNLSGVEKDQSLIGIIGQERAIRALKLGIELYSPGYNVFVCGITGTGRASTVRKILDQIKGSCPLPPDRCYVHNFAKPDEPRLLTLPRGMAERFRADMERLVRGIQTEVAGLLESDQHARKREKIVARFEGEGDRIIERFERRAEKEGFALKRVREGNISRPELFPIVAGHAMPMNDIDKAINEGKVARTRAEMIIRKYQTLRQNLEVTARQSRDLLSRMEADLSDLEKKESRETLDERIAQLTARFPGEGPGSVAAYLKEVREEIIDNLDLFRRPAVSGGPPAAGVPGSSPNAQAPAVGSDGSIPPSVGLKQLLDRFRVNVIFDSRRQGACPVIVETHPTYRRLFGYYERTLDQSGHWSTDYTMIRAGSLLSADGGYLVVTAEDLFSQRNVWMELKRTLISRTLAIMEEDGGLYVPTVSMKPAPIPTNLKVIMIGHRDSYQTLLEAEPDFRKIFKVLADFDEEMDLNPKTLRQYAAFVRRICMDEKLGELEPPAIAGVAEYGARLAGRQGKLSTRFGEIADLLREADYWRRQNGGGRRVMARHVRSAIRESIRRRNLPEDKLREMVKLGQIMIDVTGERVGQVNGLVIQDTGTHLFGLPARITATASPGTTGIINIEREAQMSGRTHTKGVLIIAGFLREKFGATKPINVTASLAFEQSYSGVEGDSASSTEIYALLSALSGLPVRQGIGVTGSVDQKGDVQPVGGINDKIEGFFKVCLMRGLTGDQGVILPEANIQDLMLDPEIVEAVRKRLFHVYPVRSVEEGIEILTGVPAGSREPSGRYPETTIFRRVDDKLTSYNEMIRRQFPGAPV